MSTSIGAAERPSRVEVIAAQSQVEIDAFLGLETPTLIREAARLYDDPSLPWPPAAVTP